MFGLRNAGTAAGNGEDRRFRPALTARWLRYALFANRRAFEREMRRDRRGLERRYEAYIKRENSRLD